MPALASRTLETKIRRGEGSPTCSRGFSQSTLSNRVSNVFSSQAQRE
jgi:hypothetical protein